jgi:pimeloyl-ACP methyl ester carboxylesterase
MADTWAMAERARNILFLHGLGTTSRMWDQHVRLLAEFNCLNPDLPGHGTRSGQPWVSLADAAAEVARLIEAAPGGRAHVVGLSLGGAVAIELINTRPELLDRVLIDGAAAIPWRFSGLLSSGAAIVSPAMHSAPFMRLIAWSLSIKADRWLDFSREFRLVNPGSFRRSVRHALAARLRNFDFSGPVLLIAGSHDIGAARVSNATLARILPNATAWYAPGAWHAWAGTNPDLHRATVRAFVTGQPLPEGLVAENSRPRAVARPRVSEPG